MTLESPHPTISIVVPVFNAEKYLAQTLESVRAQSEPSWELIAVDDGSSDGSADIARAFADQDPRIRLVQQPNAGVAAARNRGYVESDPATPYVIFLDNDDLWCPDTLEILRHSLDANPTYVAAHGQAEYIDADSRPLTPEQIQDRFESQHLSLQRRLTVTDKGVVPCPHATQTGFETFAVTNCIVSPGIVLLRRAALPASQVFDAQVAPCDDWDLYLRLSRHAPFGYARGATLKYRLHNTNASSNVDVMRRANDYVVHKTETSSENTPHQTYVVQVGFLHWQFKDVRDCGRSARRSLRRLQLIIAVKQTRKALYIFRHARYHLFKADLKLRLSRKEAVQ